MIEHMVLGENQHLNNLKYKLCQHGDSNLNQLLDRESRKCHVTTNLQPEF